jgi:hypothetical protein
MSQRLTFPTRAFIPTRIEDKKADMAIIIKVRKNSFVQHG